MNAAIVDMINLVVQYATDFLMPILLFTFILAVIMRLLITVTIHRQRRFVKEFCKRVHEDIMARPEPIQMMVPSTSCSSDHLQNVLTR